MNDGVGQHERQKEAEDEGEYHHLGEASFFEVFIGEACEGLPLFSENFIAVPYKANNCGH